MTTEAPQGVAPPQATRPARSAAGFVLARTFADPVRSGRLTGPDWPVGLRAIVAVGLGLYGVFMLIAVAASVLRQHSRLLLMPPDQTVPALTVPLVAVALIMTLSCLLTAALHLVWWLRLPISALVVAVLLTPVEWSQMATIDWVTVALAGLVLGVVLVRWNAAFHWLEFVIALGLIGHAVLADLAVRLADLRDISPSLGLDQLAPASLTLWALAVPVAILAGAALVEITTAAITWTVTQAWREGIARRRHPGRWLWAVLLVLIGVRAVQVTGRLASATDPLRLTGVVAGAAVAAAVGAGCWGVSGLADRVGVGVAAPPDRPEALLPVWSRLAPGLGLVLAAGISLPFLAGQVLRGFGWARGGALVTRLGGETAPEFWSLVSTVVAISAAVVFALRGWRTAAVLLMAFGAYQGAALVVEQAQIVVPVDGVVAALSIGAVGLLIWLVWRRRASLPARVLIAGVLLVTAAYPYRGWFDEPLGRVLGLSGVSAALLVGLLWRVLTDHAYARGDSARFPRPSRVLLALANAIVGVATAAQVALRGGQFDLDLTRAEDLGDHFLGFPLVLAVAFAGLSLAVRNSAARVPH